MVHDSRGGCDSSGGIGMRSGCRHVNNFVSTRIADNAEMGVNPELYTSWVGGGGGFYFKAYTFEELVRRLQRWYDFDVLYRDEGIRQRRFPGD